MKKGLYIPLWNSTVCADNRADYLAQLSTLSVERIFLAVERTPLFAKGEARRAHLEHLRENVAVFTRADYRVGVWFNAFGFGNPLSDEEKELTKGYIPLRAVSGKERAGHDAFCPESEAFMTDYLALVRDLATSGVDMLMLDDDLCLSVRPGIGCFCEKHITLLEQELGESLTDADLPTLFFAGGPDRYRDAWHRVMGNTLRRFAQRVRQAVNEVDSALRVGFCAGYTSWDIEGVDAAELTRILAGDTKPFLRFTGAPYWAARSVDRFQGLPLAAIIEEARAQEHFCRDSGIEVFFEADSYPRPRYAVPSSLLECFALPLHASGGMGELSYLFDYISSPSYETGYLKHRLYNKPLYDFIAKHFNGLPCHGVQICNEMDKIRAAHLPAEVNEKTVMRGHFNRGAELMGVHAIPTVYESAPCAIAFGEEARHLRSLPQRLILDAKAARILQERGFDAGFTAMEAAPAPAFEWFGKEKLLLSQGGADGYHRVTLRDGALVRSEYEACGQRFPSAYTYRAGDTELLVFTFDADRLPHYAATLLSYARAAQLRDFCPPLPAVAHAPGLYQLCKSDGETTALLFVNIGEDPILDGEIVLDGSYATAELCGITGSLQGNKITLTAPVAPYGAFAAVVKK